MIRLNKDSYIMLGILAAIVIVAIVAVYMPQSSKLKELRKDIVTCKREMESDAQKASVVPALLREVNALKGRYKNFDRRLPKSKELAGFLRDISSELASEPNIVSESYTTASPTREELFHKLPIKMHMKGSYIALVNFLNRISNMERLTRVEKLSIAAADDDSDLDIDMQLNIYFTEN